MIIRWEGGGGRSPDCGKNEDDKENKMNAGLSSVVSGNMLMYFVRSRKKR